MMSGTNRLKSPEVFSGELYEVLAAIHPGITDLDQNEFRYALENLLPADGWDSLELDSQVTIERQLNSRAFYESIQLKPRAGERIVLDKKVENLTCILFLGLVEGKYSQEWVKARFYFDIRGFYFLPRTVYFTNEVLAHFGAKPYISFAKRQQRFEHFQGVGYKDFMQANAEIDKAFIESMKQIIARRGTPILVTLAGPTAAGKTEITERLLDEFTHLGYQVATIEVDNFLLDREVREDKAMGKESTHFEIFIRSLEQILQGEKVAIPRYDFVNATSSHDRDGNLRPGCIPLEVAPADIIFMEGNFPFHIEEIARLIRIKVVYLTDDPIRLKRKWKRDIDYRKKYDPAYFRNRYFKTQFLRAEDIYRPLMQVCDLVVDTTNACLWATLEIANLLDSQ
jgi:uridine kinase